MKLHIWNIWFINGKYITLQYSMENRSECMNHKRFFSIVLLPLVDANYNFIFIDMDCQGRISDGAVFANTELYKQMEENSLNIPQSTHLNKREEELSFLFLGNKACALSENLIKVYSSYYAKLLERRIFNYGLCSACRFVENVIGIASLVFRVVWKPLLSQLEKTSLFVLAVILQHNFLEQIWLDCTLHQEHLILKKQVL
ncbi:hypothetical protein WH47_03700 [Habropoda laboriosa]|uniref:DDE Tnp4 domain-containing protein n=1 Tax=Habropoda laboriosa TaxID=597456 RepID=A0A0L7QXY4_9HYME|nr:hypothetical protein WH47_03700 [Habropoda laboriosa]